MMDLPIACTLNEADFHDRRQTIIETFRTMQVAVSELSDGYSFSLAASSEALHRLAQLVDLERQCCPFLRFAIVVEAAQAAIRLEVTGPAEARKLIGEYFSFANEGIE
jgi:hypothetical protein